MDDLIGYEGLYQINRQGEVWSCKHKKMMKTRMAWNGYLTLTLRKDGSYHCGFQHRLLAIQYIPNPENKSDVDHIDRNRANNDLSNLRWATHRENMNNLEDNPGCVKLCPKSTERLGHEYYRAEYYVVENGLRKRVRSHHRDKELLEEWVRTKGGVEIPPYIQKGIQREAIGWITTHKKGTGGYRAVFRDRTKQSKDRAVCEAWLEEQRKI